MVLAGAVLLALCLFLAVLAVALVRRSRDGAIRRWLAAALALTGGLAMGSLFLFGATLATAVPIAGAVLLLSVERWHSGRATQAGWLLLGATLPWTILWGWYAAGMVFAGQPFEPVQTWVSFLVGLCLASAAAVLAHGDAPAIRSDPGSAGGPGNRRSFGAVAAAIRDANSIGPFPMPELAAFLTLVVTSLGLTWLAPIPGSAFANTLLAVVVGSALATEAYVHGMSRRGRLAFEAVSWAGEWEIVRARAETGGGVPTTRRGAERWLARHPGGVGGAWLRTAELLLAGRFDEARACADRMPDGTPVERFERIASHDLVEWRTGGSADLADLEAAAGAILPRDDDVSLHAAVSVALSKVRWNLVDGPVVDDDVIEPLVAVRERLGPRADGHLGRALRRRLFPAFLGAGLVLTTVAEVLGQT